MWNPARPSAQRTARCIERGPSDEEKMGGPPACAGAGPSGGASGGSGYWSVHTSRSTRTRSSSVDTRRPNTSGLPASA